MPETDPTKAALEAIKETVCPPTPLNAGPLQDEQSQDEFVREIRRAATLGESLLNDPNSPLYTPASRWLFWKPIETHGLDGDEIAREACRAACAALDAYCKAIASTSAAEKLRLLLAAAEYIWQLRCIYGPWLRAEGIN